MHVVEGSATMIPLGKPFSNSSVFLLDDQLQLSPLGITGDIYIGGVGVGRGYLNQPELTHARFINYGKERLYKTGDRGRRTEDGNILFTGRADDQVKINGYRVEPGEIEQVLMQSGIIKHAVVAARDGIDSNKRLIAWVVPGVSYSTSDLQNFASKLLPAHMVPASIVIMEQLPVTTNGKIDRQALPDADSVMQPGNKYVAPRNIVEEKLTAAWQQVLGLPQVGVQDDFFALGGHSLLAVRLVSVIKKELNAEVTIADIFDCPTIDMMASRCKISVKTEGEAADKKVKNRHVALLNKMEKGEPIFIIPGIGGRTEMFKPLAMAFGDEHSVYGINMKGSDKREKPLSSVEELAFNQVKWIKGIQPGGKYRLMGHCFGGNIAYEMARQLERKGDKVEFIAILEGSAGRPPNTASPDTHAEYFLKMASEYFERLDIMTPPYPDWVSELYQDLKKLPIRDMAFYTADFIKSRQKSKKRDIEFALRLINVRISNIHMDYQPSEKLDTDIILFTGEKTQWCKEGPDPLLGWGEFARNVNCYTVCGGDYNMIDTQKHIIDEVSSAGIVRYLKERSLIGKTPVQPTETPQEEATLPCKACGNCNNQCQQSKSK
jgi:thioesterase domain-containing protein